MTEHCEYYVQDGINIFIMHQSSREAADAFAEMWGEVLTAAQPDVPIRILMDLRPAGPPPLGYAARRVNEAYSLYGKPGQQVRSAFLFNESRFIRMVGSFLELMWTNATRRYFEGDSFDEAFAWLQSDEV